MLFTFVLDVPVFRTRIVPVIAWAKSGVETCTLAELVNEPNRPNTKPATAMAAMSVMAIRITVAKTGEMAFLRLALLMFNGLLTAYEKVPENGTCPPFDRKSIPVKASPATGVEAVVQAVVPAPAVIGIGTDPAPAVTVTGTVAVGLHV